MVSNLEMILKNSLEGIDVLKNSYRLNSPACIAEAVENDLIIINLSSGRYYNIRHETVAVWQALTQGVTPVNLLQANEWDVQLQERFKAHIQFLLDDALLVPDNELLAAVDAPRIDLADADNPFHVDVFTDMQEMLLLDPIHDADANVGWPHKA